MSLAGLVREEVDRVRRRDATTGGRSSCAACPSAFMFVRRKKYVCTSICSTFKLTGL